MATRDPKKKAPPRPYHHGDLKKELVRSALELLEEVGPHELSLREVARKAGVSHAAPYRHFPEKEALLAAMAEEGYAELARSMAAAFETPGDDALLAFQRTGRAYVELAMRRPELFRLMFSGMICNLEKYESLLQTAAGTFGVLRGSVESCQRAGVMRAGDPDALAITAWCTAHGLAMLVVEKQIEFLGGDARERIVGVFATLMDGMRNVPVPRVKT